MPNLATSKLDQEALATIAGMNPGAAMVTTCEDGYMVACNRTMMTAAAIRKGTETMPELYFTGDLLRVIALASESVDIYKIMDAITARGGSLNGLHRPACLNLCVIQRHTRPGVADRLLVI
jgi:hypothetical protein